MNVILQALINGVILGAALAALVWLALRAAPRRSVNAATRYAVWCAALLVVALLPLALMPWSWPAPASATKPRPPLAKARILAAEPDVAGGVAIESPPAIDGRTTAGVRSTHAGARRAGPVLSLPVRLPEGRWIAWLLAACGVASAFMLMRFTVSYAVLVVRQSQTPHAPSGLAGRAPVWLYRCGCRRKHVRLRLDASVTTPFVVGPFRPSIILPESFLTSLGDHEIEQVGLHEAAHLARRDDFALLAQRVLEALAVWNPAVRWIGRHIELEREIACDDMVIAVTGAPRPYASCLTRVAELACSAPMTVAAAAVAEPGDLARRVEMLLDRTRHRGAHILKARMAAALAMQLALVWAVAQTPALVALAGPPAQAPTPSATQTVERVVPATEKAPDLVGQWIAGNAVRLKTAEARHGFADMQPLKQMIGNARIVSLGEATHGTREFFQLKHRMMEFLATEMGFTIFSIEANMPEAYRLNEYVLEGKGDPAKLLAGMYFWTWNTEEVLDMIQWMREFNQSGKGRIQFTGFDMQFPNVAAENVREFVASHDADYVPALAKASELTGAGARRQQQQAARKFGVATGVLPVEGLLGKRIRLSGYIRTAGVTDGYAGLWCRVDGPERKTRAFANLGADAPVGTTDWKSYSLELAVAPDAININFGMLLSGGGTAWFDGVSIEVDGKPYPMPRHDLDFEGQAIVSFFTGTAPWKVELDSAVAHSGRQSLRIRCDGPPPPPPAPVAPSPVTGDAAAAADAWKAVVEHLTTSRDAYRTRQASAAGIAWAIQNARVVEQCLLGRANKVPRDRSMAENVKWILDQNPGAKIVLWAHNGHVATGGYRGYQPMGADLRRMYGDQMYVFGFAFNQGSFQAIEMGKGLRDFTVGPAPAGSLDATFAAAGIPIFALDLRRAPANGPVAQWLDQGHKTRTIGAGYSEASPYFSVLNARESFDGVLFVEKTTAARKNVR